jgi:hypothetical protein
MKLVENLAEWLRWWDDGAAKLPPQKPAHWAADLIREAHATLAAASRAPAAEGRVDVEALKRDVCNAIHANYGTNLGTIWCAVERVIDAALAPPPPAERAADGSLRCVHILPVTGPCPHCPPAAPERVAFEKLVRETIADSVEILRGLEPIDGPAAPERAQPAAQDAPTRAVSARALRVAIAVREPGDFLLEHCLAFVESAEREREEAIQVLAPAMPASGLVDACRQRQQAYVTERDNASEAERQLAAVRRELSAVLASATDWKREFEMYRKAWIRELGGTLIRKTHEIDALVLTTQALVKERDDLRRKLNTPEVHNFVRAVILETLHQRERWGSEHDAGKTDADWFWLIGYLAGKALHNPPSDNGLTPDDLRLHRIITIAAAAANWHAARTGAHTDMRPGIAPPGGAV